MTKATPYPNAVPCKQTNHPCRCRCTTKHSQKPPRGSTIGIDLFDWVIVRSPSMLFITQFPNLLFISQYLLDLLNRRLVARILANIITDLDSLVSCCRAQLDNNIERSRLVT